MINYNWVISSMDEYPSSEGLTDVVFNVHWRRQATEASGSTTYFAETYSVLSVPAPAPEDFVPYENLTQVIVEGWLDAGLNVAAIDASLATQIENQKNPPVVSLPLPWNSGSLA